MRVQVLNGSRVTPMNGSRVTPMNGSRVAPMQGVSRVMNCSCGPMNSAPGVSPEDYQRYLLAYEFGDPDAVAMNGLFSFLKRSPEKKAAKQEKKALKKEAKAEKKAARHEAFLARKDRQASGTSFGAKLGGALENFGQSFADQGEATKIAANLEATLASLGITPGDDELAYKAAEIYANGGNSDDVDDDDDDDEGFFEKNKMWLIPAGIAVAAIGAKKMKLF